MENEIILKEVNGENDLYLLRPKSIYILLADDNSVKIGVSNNVKYRMNVLENQTGKTILKYYYTPQCSNSFEIESKMHKIFNNKKIYGEWFDIDYSEAVKELKDIFKNTQKYKYGSRLAYLKGLDEINKKAGIIMEVNNVTVDSLLIKLQEKVNLGLISDIPKNYREAMNMLCNEKIKYYSIVNESL